VALTRGRPNATAARRSPRAESRPLTPDASRADITLTKPGIVAGGQNSDGETGFTIGTADNLCGVEGKAVIVHRGGDGTTGSPGTRVACGILTQA